MRNLPKKINPHKLPYLRRLTINTLRSNSRFAAVLLCIFAMMTCVSVTFAWFGSTYENLNTVITMGDYSTDVSVFDEFGSLVESQTAKNGESVSFNNNKHMTGWSSGKSSVYYISLTNTGDIDIKLFLQFTADFTSVDGGNYSSETEHFYYSIKDVTDSCAAANGLSGFMALHQIPKADRIRSDGTSFLSESTKLAGSVTHGENRVFAIYFCCYDLCDELISKNNSFMFNVKLVTSQLGMPEEELIEETTEASTAAPATEASTAAADKAKAAATKVKAVEKNDGAAHKKEWEWKYGEDKKKGILTAYNGSETELVLPSVIDDVLITEIDSNAFRNSKVEELVIPANVDTISANAFVSDTLKSVSIQEKTTVGDKSYMSPFKMEGKAIFTADKSALVRLLPQYDGEQYQVPASVHIIYDNAFSGCNKLVTIYVKNVGAFSPATFRDSHIENIYLFNDEPVKASGTKVFGDCKKVTLHVLESLEGAYKKSGVTAGYTVKADLDVDNYESYPYTFYCGCEYKILSKGDTYKGETYSFGNEEKFVILTGYESIPKNGIVEIPKSIVCDGKQYMVAAVASGAFKNCHSIKQVVLPGKQVKYAADAFDGCEKLGVIQYSDIVSNNAN